jgi:hypothetical protein
VFTAIHLGAIVATIWVLLLNGVVGYQLVDDGTPLSLGLILLSAIALFVGTGYIALDTAFSWTGHFAPNPQSPNYNLGLYILYQLVPLIFLVVFFFLESWLVLRVLGERKPMRKYTRIELGLASMLTRCSLPLRRSTSLRDRSDLRVRRQRLHL